MLPAARRGCAAVIAADLVRHKQHMWIMNVVWPVSALFGSIWIVWQYFAYGRRAEDARAKAAMARGQEMPSNVQTPFPVIVANRALHCGIGCTLGDILAEWLTFLVPGVAAWFGYQSLFGDRVFAVWVVGYLLAYALGIVFQCFTIAPMRSLGVAEGIRAAVKADTLSLTAWQVGMYGFMAFAYFYLFGRMLSVCLEANMAEFWFMMQLAMVCGFVTAYPVNWWLIRTGLKGEI